MTHHKRGRRPGSTYTEEIAEEIVDRMIHGEHLSQICADPDLPCRETVRKWEKRYPKFADSIQNARSMLAEHYVDKLLDAAEKVTADNITAANYQFKVYSWYAERVAPREWGAARMAAAAERVGNEPKIGQPPRITQDIIDANLTHDEKDMMHKIMERLNRAADEAR